MGCKNAGRWLRPPEIVRKTTAHEPISNQRNGAVRQRESPLYYFFWFIFRNGRPKIQKKSACKKHTNFHLSILRNRRLAKENLPMS